MRIKRSIAALAVASLALSGAVVATTMQHSTAPTVTPDRSSAAAIAVPHDLLASIYPDLSIPPCAYEDSHNCYWDAATRGNGHGRSFIDLAGHVFYAPAAR